MKATPLISLILIGLLAVHGCDSDSSTEGTGTGTGTGTTSDQLTLANCVQSYEDGVPGFYSTYFACVEVSADGDGTVVTTDNLPPHPSAYYPEDSPNYVAFDTRGGTHYRNPKRHRREHLLDDGPRQPRGQGHHHRRLERRQPDGHER